MSFHAAFDGSAAHKLKKCKQCRCEFIPERPIQTVCGLGCAVQLAKKKREKIERAADRQKRESLKSRAQWLREAQTAFNACVRAEGEGSPCISCGRHHDGQWHAGHYLSIGARPELRFEPDNCWRQCQPCNTHLHGNLVLYRASLVEKIGIDRVEWLEGPHEQKKYSIEDLKSIKAFYKRKLKELRNAR